MQFGEVLGPEYSWQYNPLPPHYTTVKISKSILIPIVWFDLLLHPRIGWPTVLDKVDDLQQRHILLGILLDFRKRYWVGYSVDASHLPFLQVGMIYPAPPVCMARCPRQVVGRHFGGLNVLHGVIITG